MRYQFRPQWLTTIITLILLVVMTKLGFWQYAKAQQKQALQSTYDARTHLPAVDVSPNIADIEDWRYRRIKATGQYLTDYQIFLDNQVEGEVAGYHVITPLRADNGTVILVDRGWIPMGDRSHFPTVSTPAGTVSVMGFSWIPSPKFFQLAPPGDGKGWQPIWQNMEMARYAKQVPFNVLPFVMRLDADSTAGGFVRNWVMPAERVEKHIGYAYQWWGFSLALFFIWVFVNLKRKS